MKFLVKYIHTAPVTFQLEGTGTDVHIKFLGLRMAQYFHVYNAARTEWNHVDLETSILTIEMYNDQHTEEGEV